MYVPVNYVDLIYSDVQQTDIYSCINVFIVNVVMFLNKYISVNPS